MSHICRYIVVDGIEGGGCDCIWLVVVSLCCFLGWECWFWGHVSMSWRN